MPETSQIAIVLIHHRMQSHLRECLRNIALQAPSPGTRTIVVHLPDPEDPADQNGAWIVAEFPFVELLLAPKFGIASMRNIGLRAALIPHDSAPHDSAPHGSVSVADFVLILDADARLEPGAIESMTAFMREHPRCAVCAARTLRPDGSLERNAKRFYDWTTVAVRRSPLNRLWPTNPWTARHLMLDADWTRPFECDWVAGACMFLRAETIRAIGEFDERFTFGFEDVDWCYRAKRAGDTVMFCPEATVIHHVQRRSARGINGLTIEHLKSLWRFYRKHGRLNG